MSSDEWQAICRALLGTEDMAQIPQEEQKQP
jgi:hypothetical protein